MSRTKITFELIVPDEALKDETYNKLKDLFYHFSNFFVVRYRAETYLRQEKYDDKKNKS